MKEELQAIQDLALTLEALQDVLTMLNFAENLPSYASQDIKDNPAVKGTCRPQESIVNADSTVAGSPTNGLAEIQGTVDVASNLGIEAPQRIGGI